MNMTDKIIGTLIGAGLLVFACYGHSVEFHPFISICIGYIGLGILCKVVGAII